MECPATLQQGSLKFLRATGILLPNEKDAHTSYLRKTHFSIALLVGLQWTKYCPWVAGICKLPITLNPCLLLGAGLLLFGYILNTVVKLLNIWFTTLEAPDLFAVFLRTIPGIAKAHLLNGEYVKQGQRSWPVPFSSSDARASSNRKRQTGSLFCMWFFLPGGLVSGGLEVFCG